MSTTPAVSAEADRVGSVQYVPAVLPEGNEPHVQSGSGLMPFFAAGMVVNVVMLAAFFIWAYKQWKKK